MPSARPPGRPLPCDAWPQRVAVPETAEAEAGPLNLRATDRAGRSALIWAVVRNRPELFQVRGLGPGAV